MRNRCFLQVRLSHVLHFISICDLFTDFCMNLCCCNVQMTRQHSTHTGLPFPISRLCVVDVSSALGCVWVWDALPASSWC
jgi:hypothetical protein